MISIPNNENCHNQAVPINTFDALQKIRIKNKGSQMFQKISGAITKITEKA